MTASWFFVLLAGILGLAVGSFLNVVIYRVPRAESVVSPPSHCPRCDVPIRGRHNVPVISWLALRGRCASCHVPISARYPLVEAVTGALFAGIVLRFGVTVQVPAFLYLAAIGVALAMIDFDLRRLPDTLVLPSYLVAVVLLVPAAIVGGDLTALLRALAGAALLAASGLALLSHDRGYAKLAGLLGLYLGWISWTALVAGAAVALLAMLCTARRLRSVPPGPILIAGAALVVFGTFAV